MTRKLVWLAVLVTALQAQDSLGSLEAAFNQGRSVDLLQRLIAYHDSIPDNSSFEVDYMIAATLAELPQFKDSACDYSKAIVSTYRTPFVFERQQVTMTPIQQRVCPPPPGPGVATTFSLKIVNKAAVLNQVRSKLRSQTAAVVVPTDGNYALVYDGWKAQLSLRGIQGTFMGSDGHVFAVRVLSTEGYHIVFIVVGLGGETFGGRGGVGGGQRFDGYLMTQTRDAIAGLTWWQNHPFGFYAVKR